MQVASEQVDIQLLPILTNGVMTILMVRFKPGELIIEHVLEIVPKADNPDVSLGRLPGVHAVGNGDCMQLRADLFLHMVLIAAHDADAAVLFAGAQVGLYSGDAAVLRIRDEEIDHKFSHQSPPHLRQTEYH